MASCNSRRSVDFHGLQSLACKVFLEEVLSKVTPETVNFVRDFIEQQNADLVKKTIREWCVKELYQMMGLQQQPPSVDIFAVMDCILDVHFTSLKVCVPSPAFKSFSHLMAIITHRCPNLQELEVKFQNTEETFSQNELYTIPHGSQLPHLKSLKLNFPPAYDATETQETRESLLQIIGKLCPVLSKLEVGECCLNKMDILALIVDVEMASILFPQDGHRWSQDSALSGLRIPAQFLTPLVNTLKELILRRTRASDRESLVSALAFALQHLPKLENLQVAKVQTLAAIKSLYEERNANQKSFENAWKEAASRLGLYVALPVTFFPGTLSLKRLESVPLTDVEMLLAVSELCTSPQHVQLVGCSSSSSQLEGISVEMKKWANVIESVDLDFDDPNTDLDDLNFDVGDPTFVKMVFTIFGPKIKSLSLSVGCEIDMDHLATNCTNLKTVAFHSCNIIMDSVAARRWTPETFLPKLTGVYRTNPMDECLGIWGLLIEQKSSLVHLSLRCCHIGTDAHNPRLEWSQLPQLWTNLESLEIEHCTGLTMATLLEILPQFPKLRWIDLPSTLSLSQNHRVTLKQKMLKEKHIEINFSDPFDDSNCYF